MISLRSFNTNYDVSIIKDWSLAKIGEIEGKLFIRQKRFRYGLIVNS